LRYQKITGSPGDYFQIALKDRPDLSMFEEDARAEGAKIVQYRSDYFPTVTATAGYNAMGTGLPAANNFDVGIVISWPIFNGFLTEHQVAEMRLRQKAVRDAIEDLRQRIYLEVKSAFLDWQTSLQRIREAELTLQASKVELELASKRYTTGLGNIIELTDAERFFVEDNAAYVNALYQFSVAKAAVGRATGALLAEQ
jgi:outer membrane protein